MLLLGDGGCWEWAVWDVYAVPGGVDVRYVAGAASLLWGVLAERKRPPGSVGPTCGPPQPARRVAAQIPVTLFIGSVEVPAHDERVSSSSRRSSAGRNDDPRILPSARLGRRRQLAPAGERAPRSRRRVPSRACTRPPEIGKRTSPTRHDEASNPARDRAPSIVAPADRCTLAPRPHARRSRHPPTSTSP